MDMVLKYCQSLILILNILFKKFLLKHKQGKLKNTMELLNRIFNILVSKFK